MFWLKTVAWPLLKIGAGRVWAFLKWSWNERIPTPILLIGVAGALYLLTCARLAWVQADLDQLRTRLKQAEDACAAVNRSNLDTIQALQSNLSACVGQNQDLVLFAGQAETVRQALERQLSQERRERAKQRETLYETEPDCRAIRDVPVCDAVAERLQVPGQDRNR